MVSTDNLPFSCQTPFVTNETSVPSKLANLPRPVNDQSSIFLLVLHKLSVPAFPCRLSVYFRMFRVFRPSKNSPFCLF